MSYTTQLQGNPNVILQAPIDKTTITKSQLDAAEAAIEPESDAAYVNGATTVKVVDLNNVQIGAYPRRNPNA